jgi:hypothetical protein
MIPLSILCLPSSEDWDNNNGGPKLNGQKNTFVLNSSCDGNRGTETISKCFKQIR